jgi:aspartyl protease family protein
MNERDPDDDPTHGGRGLGAGGWLWIAAVVLGVAVLIGYLWRSNPGAVDSDNDLPRLVYLMVLLAALGGGFLFRSALRVRESLRNAAIWIVVALALLVAYSYRDVVMDTKNRVTGELFPQAGEIRDGAIIYRRADDGHFHIDAEINGQPVRFLVDTGATSIVLSKEDAERVGLDPQSLRFTSMTQTANGTVYDAPVRLDEMRIGPLTARDVPAHVSGGDTFGSLLGMRFLDRLSGYEVQGDRLILRP